MSTNPNRKVFAFCLVILVAALVTAGFYSNFSWQDALVQSFFVSMLLIYWELRGRW